MTREERTQQTHDRIVAGLLSHKYRLCGASDIAHLAGMAESTVRRHLPDLIRQGRVKHTSYVGLYAPGPAERT